MAFTALLSQPSTSRTGALLAQRGFLCTQSVLAPNVGSSAGFALPRVALYPTQAAFAARPFSSSRRCETSHFDTHQFVQRLEGQGLNRTQAEGVMTVLAEVVDESIKGMEAALVSKAEQEKVSQNSSTGSRIAHAHMAATVHPEG
jgi:hypothetical protein